MNYLSLFSGIGGFELGIQQAYEENIQPKIKGQQIKGYSTNTSGEPLQGTPSCVGYSETDKYAVQIYQKHFPTHKNWGDITTIIAEELPDFDLIVGGFPCQSFSIAGKRGGFKDTRGTLFFDIARIAKAKRPSYLLLENVKGLLNHDKGNTFATIISTLDELGYDCQWSVLNSKNFGVPQNRERVFIVGHLRGIARPKVFPIRGSSKEAKGVVYHQKSDREIARIYSPEGLAPTLHLKTGGWQEPKIATAIDANYYKGNSAIKDRHTPRTEIKNGSKIRRLTPTECERLQGFPDGFTKFGINEKGEEVLISDTQRYKVLGNAITTNVVKEIMEKINASNNNT